MKSPALLLLAALFPLVARAAELRGDQADAPPSTAQEQLAKFHVPPGFEVQLVTDETQIQKPMNITFDGAGRLWVTGSELYPWPAKTDPNGQPIAAFQKQWDDAAKQFGVGTKAPQPSEHGRDTVRVLSDFGPDGRARKVEIFAEKLNIPIGLQPLPRKPGAKGDSVIVHSIPNIWLFTDTDGDGKADKNEPLYEGFGFKDTHGMASNFLHWIDGWVYGCHGFSNHSEVRDRAGRVTVLDSGNTYRFRPDGSAFEIYSHGQTNPFGLAVDPLGNFYTADSHSKPVYLVLRGGYYEGIGKQHDGLGFAPRIMDHDHGSSSIAGVAYYAAEHFPKEFWGNTFNGNPVTRRINRDRLEWTGSTPKAIEMPDFLTCDDPWFRPVQVKLGPDGALWIADFYNPIIGHYEVPLTDPRRDHTHGRIWRVVWKGEDARTAAVSGDAGTAVPGSARDPRVPLGDSPSGTGESVAKSQIIKHIVAPAPVPPGGSPDGTRESRVLPMIPDLASLDAAGLIEKLGDPNLTVRILATHELVERKDKQTGARLESMTRLGNAAQYNKAVEELVGGSVLPAMQWNASPGVRFHALWVLERLRGVDQETLDLTGLDDSADGIARVAAVRILVGRGPLSSKAAYGAFGNLFGSPEDLGGWIARRAATEVRLQKPSDGTVLLFAGWEHRLPHDSELAHAIRIALRNVFLPPKAYDSWMKGIEDHPAVAELIADVSLGAPTPHAAEFLLAHLSRTNLAAPRTGEFLKHVALHLPAERLGELAALVETIKDAPLPQRLEVADNLAQAIRQRGAKLPEALAAWTQRVMIDALGTSDDGLLKRAIESVRESKSDEKFEPLARVIQDPKRHGPLRAAALEAVANIDLGPAALAGALADPSSMTLRKKAAELLGQQVANANVEHTLLAALPCAPWELATSIAAGLAKTDASSLALLTLIETGKASPALLRNKTVATALSQRPAAAKERAAALTKDLPPEDARLDGVIAARVAEFRAAKPDAKHGEQVFQQACAACHKVKNVGGNLAPNLDAAAARGLHRLLEDILDPNRNVDPAFAQVVVETTDGQLLAGVGPRAEGELIVMNDAAGKPVSVPKAQIKTQTQSRLSLMPPTFETTLSGRDLNDLVAYLNAQTDTPTRSAK